MSTDILFFASLVILAFVGFVRAVVRSDTTLRYGASYLVFATLMAWAGHA
ncbi:hypothetical protein [Azospirillum soli]|nr:hypothetical protein [Azospirillum soli]MBP2315521.1 hypothetical protein [Azospirillum soli]